VPKGECVAVKRVWGANERPSWCDRGVRMRTDAMLGEPMKTFYNK
jgi:hypothetical protein